MPSSNLKMHTPNLVDSNIDRLAALFPNCVTEKPKTDEQGKVIRDMNGEVVLERGIDFELLKQELSHSVIDGSQERYRLDWVGKREAIVTANSPIAKTLRPCRDESVDFETTGNLFIEGDNLEALKLLQESYLGKVKMIYIDPPYNTGNDFIYNDDFAADTAEFFERSGQVDGDGNRLVANTESNGRFHSDWLSMMYSRLKLTRNLLTEDGFAILAMDDSEVENLIKICDEIFGEHNKIGVITVVHKPEGRNQEKFLGTSNEFALVYAKNKKMANFRNIVLDKEKLIEFDYEDEKGKYKRKDFIRRADGKYATREAKPNFWYPIYVSKDLKKVTTESKSDYYEIFPVIDNGVERTWKTLPSTFIDLVKDGAIEAINENGKIVIYEKMREKQVIKTHWIKKEYHAYHFGTKILDDLLKDKTFDFPKSLYLIIDLLKLTTESNDIVIDFFAGSSTTAHAVMQLNAEDGGNRKFIMVQIPEATDSKSEAHKAGYPTIAEISKERIRRAGAKIRQDNADKDLSHLDTGFRVLKIDTSNMNDIYYRPQDYNQDLLAQLENNIKEDRSDEDLLFQFMLDTGVPLSLPIERTELSSKSGGHTIYQVGGNSLIASLDYIDANMVNDIAALNPLKFITSERAIATDSDKTNIKERFKQLSPHTDVRFI